MIERDFPSHVSSLVLLSMIERDKQTYLSETFRGPGVVCVHWRPTTDDRTAVALGHASRIVWRTKKLPDHPASKVISECVQGAANEILSGSARSNALIDDLGQAWDLLKNYAREFTEHPTKYGSLGSNSLPSVAEDPVEIFEHDSI
jgi:hypothetical protein